MTARRKLPSPTLFVPPPVHEATLSARQQIALRILRDHPKGLQAYDLGRQVHDEYGTHMDDQRDCPFCSRVGGELAQALKARGLVTQHRGGVFRAASGSRGLAAGSPTDTDGDAGWQAYMEATS